MTMQPEQGINSELSLGEVISKTFELYRRDFTKYFVLFAVVEVIIGVVTALAQHLKRDVNGIHAYDQLREDIGLDSLAMIELLFKIEETFDLEIPNDDLSQITTVGDAINYIKENT